MKYLHFDRTRMEGAFTINNFMNYQYIVYFYYSNPHQYMSLTEILKYAVEHNTWNISHTLSHLQVQLTPWPHYRSTLEYEWTCYYYNPPCTKIYTCNKAQGDHTALCFVTTCNNGVFTGGIFMHLSVSFPSLLVNKKLSWQFFNTLYSFVILLRGSFLARYFLINYTSTK